MVKRFRSPEAKRYPAEGIELTCKIRCTDRFTERSERSEKPETEASPGPASETPAEPTRKAKPLRLTSYGFWYISIPKIIVEKYRMLPDDGTLIYVYREGLPSYEDPGLDGKKITHTFKEHYHTSLAGNTMIIGLNSAWRRCHARDDDPIKHIIGHHNWPFESIYGVQKGDTVKVIIKGKRNSMSNLCTWSYYIEAYENKTGEHLEKISPSMVYKDNKWIPFEFLD